MSHEISPPRSLRARIADAAASRVVVAVLLFASIFMVSYLTWRQQDQADCVAEYNARKAVADQARAEAADADRKALEKMVRSLLDPNAAPSSGRQVLDEYLRTLEATDRKRRENPVPPPPPDLCR